MASPVDTSVKFFRNDFPGAPVLNGQNGSLIALLDALLCTGFGLRSAVSLVVADGVATLTLASDANNGNLLDSVIEIDGASISALNGEQRVTAASSTTLAFATDATDGTATGTITVKTAPAGWEKLYTGTHKAVFKSLDPVGYPKCLQIDDSLGVYAKLRGFETMSDVDTGTGAFPTVVDIANGACWAKSNAANATAQAYDVVADSRLFYFCAAPYSSSGPTSMAQTAYWFGEPVAYKSGDAFATGISGYSSTPGANLNSGTIFNSSYSSGFGRSCRDHSGMGAAIASYNRPALVFGGGSGVDAMRGTGLPATDGKLRLSEIEISDYVVSGVAAVLRGRLPGALWACVGNGKDLFVRGVRLTVEGRLLYAISNSTSGSSNWGVGFFDITGPWRAD